MSRSRYYYYIFSSQGILRATSEAFIEKLLLSLAMGCCFSFERQQKLKIEIINKTAPGQEYDYLRTEGKITFSTDSIYEVAFDGWHVNSVRLWPKNKKVRLHFLILERTPTVSPQISLSDKSGIDTVF